MEHRRAQQALENALPMIRWLQPVFNPTWSEISQLRGVGKLSYYIMEYICRVASLPLVLFAIALVSLIPWQRASRMLWWILYLFGAAHFEREMRIDLGVQDETREAKVI